MSEDDPFAALRALFRKYGFPVDSDDGGWGPTPDDWIRLALGLALEHREPGFELSKVKHLPAAWADWVRDEAVDNRYFARNPDGSLSAEKRPGITLEQACREAVRYLDKKIDSGEVQGVKKITAKSLESAYSARRRKNLKLAPVIADYLRWDGEWRKTLSQARAYTLKEPDSEMSDAGYRPEHGADWKSDSDADERSAADYALWEGEWREMLPRNQSTGARPPDQES